MGRRRDDRSEQAKRYRRLYQTPEWRRVRKAQLERVPLCERCAERGVVRAATVCNHLRPADKISEATFYRGPFSSLCAPCHDAGEQKVERAGWSATPDDDGWPVDPRHPANRPRGRSKVLGNV